MPGRALAGIRVLEYGQFVAGPYCAKLMADLGAEVTKIEPLDGDIARKRGPFPNDIPHTECSGLFLYNNTNKSGMTLDLESAEDRQAFKKLVAETDVLIEDTPPGTLSKLGLGYDTLKDMNPGLVMTSITPFGQTGPYKDYKAYYLNVSHGSALGYMTPVNPRLSSRPEREPIREGCLVAEYDCGICAALATLSALYSSLFSGTGQHIDVSKQEVLLHLQRTDMALYLEHRYPELRGSPSMFTGGSGVHHCKDGSVLLMLLEDRAWRSFIDLMGNPEWATEDRFSTPEKRRWLSPEELHPLVEPWMSQHTKEEIFHALQKRRCPASPLYSVAEVPNTERMKGREFFVDVEHPEAGTLGYPLGLAKFSASPIALERPAPLLGQHNHQLPRGQWHRRAQRPQPEPEGTPRRMPLQGVRLTDLCWVWAGPSGTKLLSYLGAEVIRIESQDHLCLTRRGTPEPGSTAPDVNRSTMYNSLNLGKRSVTVNLTQRKGIELVKRLVAMSDVVTDNFSGSMMERFGLTYPVLKEVKPDIIALSMSCWGASGPERDYRAYDPNFAALSGLYDLTGYPDGMPSLSGGRGRLDLSTGAALAFCVATALVHRAMTGEGQFVDLSQWEATNCTVGHAFMDYFMNGRSPTRVGNRDSLMAPHNTYPCQGDDKWVSIAIATDEEWQAFCRAIGKPEWLSDERFSDAASRWQNQEQLDALISKWTVNHTHYEVTDILQKADVAAFPSLSREELARDPHLLERDAFAEVAHPEAGTHTFLAPPWRLSDTPAEITRHSPLLGEHNEYVFCELLGMPMEEFAVLVGEGIIY